MKTKHAKTVLVYGILAVCGLFLSVWAEDTLPVDIEIAPRILNLQNQGQVVTVHTDIAYGLVDKSEVYLEDVLISSWKADDQGNFVAKFLIEEIKALNLTINGYNTLTLTGYTTDGQFFCGSAEIYVIDKKAEK